MRALWAGEAGWKGRARRPGPRRRQTLPWVSWPRSRLCRACHASSRGARPAPCRSLVCSATRRWLTDGFPGRRGLPAQRHPPAAHSHPDGASPLPQPFPAGPGARQRHGEKLPPVTHPVPFRRRRGTGAARPAPCWRAPTHGPTRTGAPRIGTWWGEKAEGSEGPEAAQSLGRPPLRDRGPKPAAGGQDPRPFLRCRAFSRARAWQTRYRGPGDRRKLRALPAWRRRGAALAPARVSAAVTAAPLGPRVSPGATGTPRPRAAPHHLRITLSHSDTRPTHSTDTPTLRSRK